MEEFHLKISFFADAPKRSTDPTVAEGEEMMDSKAAERAVDT
jgi:hypothetical protein